MLQHLPATATPDDVLESIDRNGGVIIDDLTRDVETQFSTIWALTDFTMDNGATRLVPGSHLWEDDREPQPDEIVAAEMRRGSVLLYNGSVLHGGGANSTGT